MDLSEFVQVSLVQIARGIEAANSELKTDTDALINPRNLAVNSGSGANYGYVTETTKYLRIVELVEFDVALNVQEQNEKSGKFGISVGSVGLGVGGKNTESNTSQSRIRFKIPVAWPHG